MGREEPGGKESPCGFVAFRKGGRHAFAVMMGQHGEGKGHEEEDAEEFGGALSEAAGHEDRTYSKVKVMSLSAPLEHPAVTAAEVSGLASAVPLIDTCQRPEVPPPCPT